MLIFDFARLDLQPVGELHTWTTHRRDYRLLKEIMWDGDHWVYHVQSQFRGQWLTVCAFERPIKAEADRPREVQPPGWED